MKKRHIASGLNTAIDVKSLPPDRADGSSSLVHRAFIFTGLLGLIPPLKLLPAWIALIAIACWPWQPRRLIVAISYSLLLALDWGILALLPIKQRSWGPVTPSLLGLTLVRILLAWGLAWLPHHTLGLGLLILLNILLSITAIYATWIEPFNLGVTHQKIHPVAWIAQRPLRLLHISDLHFEGLSPREERLLEIARDLKPELIVFTGDYLNLSSVHDPQIQAQARKYLAQFQAPRGVYAVAGTPAVDIPELIPQIFSGLSIRWLAEEAIAIPWAGDKIWLLGMRSTYNEARDIATLERLMRENIPEGALSLLLYHTPDLMPHAARLGVTLYLAGHTHGGQLRLPLYGALATSSRWGKRYEMGRYQENKTTLYVSRGIGLEGLGAPRARFLAPPEIVLWELDG
jgi:hypothetical protein